MFWNRKLSPIKAYAVILKAKEIYNCPSRGFYGLCIAFQHALGELGTHVKITDISRYIPELNKEFLEGTSNPEDLYWWGSNDRMSRIKALNKLENLYLSRVRGNIFNRLKKYISRKLYILRYLNS